MLTLGVDDSGRGPVIGPMVLAGCLIDTDLEKKFKRVGVRDSKKITPRRRRILAKFIKEKALAYEIVIIHPGEIDGRNSAGTNLNKIEAVKFADIINKIEKKWGKNINLGEKIKVIADCPSPNIPAWKAYFSRYIKDKSKLDIHAEHKADVNYISVAAGSILAKTTRDAEIEKIKKKIGIDFGSGYPSDPITCKFLVEHAMKHKKDGILRETWKTWQNVCKLKEQKKLGEY